MMKAAGKTPVMNALAAEVALRLECAGVQTLPEHLSGTLNFQCDALSRLSQGASIPTVLQDVPRAVPKDRSSHFFWAWPRTLSTVTGKVVLNACGPGDSVKVAGPSLPPSGRPGVRLRSKARASAKRARKGEEAEAEAMQFQ